MLCSLRALFLVAAQRISRRPRQFLPKAFRGYRNRGLSKMIETLPRGLHAVLKKTDFWFNYELNDIEKTARTLAVEHAQAGLPRMEAVAPDELPAEVVLRERAVHAYRGWSERVLRKIRDEIQNTSDQAAVGLIHLRDILESLERGQHLVQTTEEALELRKSTAAAQDRTFEYGSMFRRWIYFAVMILLVVVDWVANVPIFQQLLPADPGSLQAWMELSNNASHAPYALQGALRLWYRITFRPDVSILAFGVVFIIMVLGHFAGTSLRRLVSFRPKDESTTVFGLKSHRRQSHWPLYISLAGIALILAFLFTSRERLVSATKDRRDGTMAQLIDAQRNLDVSKTLEDKQKYQEELIAAQADAKSRQEAYDYATSISGMNSAIFLLNFALAIVATVAAYMENKARITDAHLADPALRELQIHLERARAECLDLARLFAEFRQMFKPRSQWHVISLVRCLSGIGRPRPGASRRLFHCSELKTREFVALTSTTLRRLSFRQDRLTCQCRLRSSLMFRPKSRFTSRISAT